MSKLVVGIDLGGTNVKAAVVSEDARVLSKGSWPTQADQGPEAVMDVMAESVDGVLAKAGADRSALEAVGIGAAGPLNWQTGIVYEPPNLPGWRNVPLADAMQERLAAPCYVDNDANVACFGEFCSGAGRGVKSMCLLTLGTGVGGGIVVLGQLLRGVDGTAAETGHIKVARDGRLCGCGATGCLEAYASVTGMVRTAQEGIEQGTQTSLSALTNGDFSKLTGKMISEAAGGGDRFATWVIQETAIWLGIGVSSLINLLNPEKVVFSGGMIAAGDALFTPLRETALKLSFEVPGKRCEILPAELGEDAGVIGAAACARERLHGRVAE